MLQIIEEDKIAITLKEITDLIEVRHNDAMRKVEDLAKEPDFGVLRKTRISHIKGKEIETYIFDKFQAITVGARLNNALLLKVMKRIEELERIKHQPLTYEETMQNALVLAAKRVDALENKIQEDKPLVSFASTVQSSINSVLIRDWVKSIGLREKDVRVWLESKGYLYKNNQGLWRLKANETAKKYFEAVPTTQSTSSGTFINYTIKITGEGQTKLTDKVLNHFNKQTLDLY